MEPVLKALGDDIIARTQRRFDTSTTPDGAPWRPNSAYGHLGMLSSRIAGVKSNARKNGGLNKRGRAQLTNKKPLDRPRRPAPSSSFGK